MGETVLVVEDEPPTARLMDLSLTTAGYRVIGVASGQAALDTMVQEQPDIVLLDLVLPHGPDGYEVCRRIREFSTVPVIMVTARAQEVELLRGFEVGADDYLTKPFGPRELLARIRAVLRRARRPEEAVNATFRYGDLMIDFAQRAVTVRGEPVALTATEYALLRELATNAGRVLPHRELLTRVWGPGYAEGVGSLRVYIHYLRRKLEADPSHPRYVLTVQGIDHMMIGPDEAPG